MATALSPQQRRMLQRRTSGIEQLSKQFQKQVAAVTGEQEQAFAKYQQGAAAQMGAYDEAVKAYQEQAGAVEAESASRLSAYQTQVSDYQKRLDDYMKAMKDWEANPTEILRPTTFSSSGRAGYSFVFPGGIQGTVSDIRRQGYEVQGLGVPGNQIMKSVFIEADRPQPTAFSEKPPAIPELGKLPEAPGKPDIPEFSTEAFQARKTALESELKRELGERRSARLAAVSRRGRTMLSGA